ncbi:MAG: polynucleotide adenylyltransferase PcnB [Pseudomonadota bacterium]|jgi:poly(A) polymerase
MIRSLLRRIFSGPARTTRRGAPAVIAREAHGIGRDRISPGALRVASTLQQHGYEAYVVGGAVRDLLVGRTPKDFDVATNATPEQVHALFRRSRIIGRRFRLVHVLAGPEVIETATFRGDGAPPDPEEAEEAVDAVDGPRPAGRRALPVAGVRQTDEHGRLIRDNVYGNREQDAARRDFTVNALFYDPSNETIIDFHGGVADVRRRSLRMIGDPARRYREDPVRMLRAVRFAASLGFEIERGTREPIAEFAPLLTHVPPARLFDETLKLLLGGGAVSAVGRLRSEGLHHGLLPMLDVILEQPLGERFVMKALENTDARVNAGRSISPGFLFATLLWHELLAQWERERGEGGGKPPMVAMSDAMDGVIARQVERLAIPRRFTAQMREIWMLQPRFEHRSGRRPFRLLEQERFRAAYDFLLLRCESGEIDAELGQWWTRFQHAAESEREQMLVADSPAAGRPRRRRRRSGRGGRAGGDGDPA